MTPGRYGRIEWFDGRNLAVYSEHPRCFAKIWAIPSVRRHQTGDQEMRAVFPPEALERVARVIQARRRRPPGSAAPLQKVAEPPYRVTSAGQERVQAARLALSNGGHVEDHPQVGRCLLP